MSLPIRGVSHTGITCSDLDRSIAFYRDVLGFPVTEKRRTGGPLMEQVTGVPGAVIDIAYVDAPGHRIELLCYAAPEDRRPSTLRPCDPGFLHLSFDVEDIEGVIDAVRPHGYEPVNPVATVTEGPGKGLRGIYTRDPDGVVLEFLERPPDPAGPPQPPGALRPEDRS
jgi:catechol 2,3-dioxygenase-like lactoylglutathione lyase family enzyme